MLNGRPNRWLWLVLLALLALPLVGPWSRGAEFAGTDSLAQTQIEIDNPGYKPWFTSVFQVTREVESFLFAAQAALGAGLLGYFVGLVHGRATRPEEVQRAAKS